MSRRIRIFVSSPGDVADERRQCGEVVEELNATMRALLPELETRLELVRWEADTHPDLAGNPQQVVDDQLVEDYDIFLGIMWSRFGTPTPTAGSGTEHEFRTARRGWEERRRPTHLLFYFCDSPIPAMLAGEHADQIKAVFTFRRELNNLGLVGSYEDRARFGDTVRRDLVLVLARLLRDGAPRAETSRDVVAGASETDLSIARQQIAALATEYGNLRETMPAGDTRTRRMEVVASQMRSLAQSAYPLLTELSARDEPGSRLAAVCVLQAIPDPAYLSWLAERIRREKPFVGYHAALALLSAARNLPIESLGQVGRALDEAEGIWQRLRPDTDRVITLGHARHELQRRLGGASGVDGRPRERHDE